MNPDELREIIKLMEASSFDELVLEMKGAKLTLRRGAGGVEHVNGGAPPVSVDAAPKNPIKAARAAPASAPAGFLDVTAPFLGVFYSAPKPGADPFVKVGDRVEKGSVVGIIEVMKLMNSVHAGSAGEVVEIFAQNGVAVEYGQPLIRVRIT
ncbi:MAG: acetyl-CoA carboxylase biotin carboxyl carrier protein [Hyphomonadaceae bacterium]|nr:acetyl-CoA carboxylase biotin carboxyl carrier protein [Hyphomonadaceae bacterium]